MKNKYTVKPFSIIKEYVLFLKKKKALDLYLYHFLNDF